MRWTIGHRLACGFAVLILLIVTPAVCVSWWLAQVRASQALILDTAQPAVTAATSVRDGLHQALAGSHGAAVGASQHFEKQRAEGWQRAEENLATLKGLTANWSTEQRHLIERLKAEIGDIQSVHQAVAADARKSGQSDSLKKLVNETSPLGERMLAAVQTIVDIELKLEKTPQRMQLLGDVHALRDSLHAALVEMHTYLTTADRQHLQNFDRQWNDNGTVLRTLRGKQHLLTREQAAQLKSFVGLRSQFQTMPKQLFALRDSGSSNAAQQRLAQEAAPREAEAAALASGLIAMQERNAQHAQHTLRKQSAMLAAFALAAPGAAAILGIYIGWRVTRRITRPLRRTVTALEALAAGDLTRRLPVESKDEFGRMAQAVNTLAQVQAEPAHEEMTLPEFDQQRLRSFVNAEINRRKPHFRPQAAPASQEQQPATEAAAELPRSLESFQSVLSQVASVAQQVQATTRRVTESAQPLLVDAMAAAQPNMRQATSAATMPEPITATARGDAELRQELAAQTELLAQSSDRLRSQTADLAQLMGRLQAGFAAYQAPPQAGEQAAEPVAEQVHTAQTHLSGPKSHVGSKQLITQ